MKLRMKKSKILLILVVFIELFIVSILLNEISNKKHLFFHNYLDDNTLLKPEHTFFCLMQGNNTRLIRELKPNCSTYFDGFLVKIPKTFIKINSDGFRDKEYSIEKPNNTFRIIALGDSFTFGWGVNISNVYTEILERKLKSLNNGINYEVLNFGVPGYNTPQEVELFKVKGLKYNPDIVILAYSTNDNLNNFQLKELRQKIKLKYEELGYNTSKLYWRREIAKEAYWTSIDESKNKYFFNSQKLVKRSLEEFHNVTSKINATVVVFYMPVTLLDNYYELLNKISIKNNWYFIENMYELTNLPLEDIAIDPQFDMHPNKFLNKMIANITYNFLLEKRLIM